MEVLQRPANVARQLIEINFNTMGELLKLTSTGVQQYLDLNAQYVQRMTSPEGLKNVMDVQRDYGKSLYDGIRGDLQGRGELLRSAFKQTSGVLSESWSATRADIEEDVAAGVDKVKSAAADISDKVEDKIEGHLAQINGVGESFAEQLREAGIYTLAQVALINIDDLADESHPLHAMRGRMESEDWIEQARELIKPW